ncbi:MAG: hypothetical protein O7J95_19125 [Planctomycetota bacterium]|nr:hypothetical protein [Planctomycetota bacterium]
MRASSGELDRVRRRKVAAAVGTVLVMALVVYVARRNGPAPGEPRGGAQQRAERSQRSAPGACLTAVVRAAERGDVQGYLDCFTGDLRGELEARSTAARPAERFAESLRASVDELTASVTSDVERPSPDAALLRWERVYRRYSESYRVRLRREGGRWRISKLTRTERGAPLVPYGTPVFPGLEESEEDAPER